jgi:formate dehydrogenase iron-sulfur subunit
MAVKAVLIDTSKCIACKGCQIACKQWNELPAGTSEFFATTEGYENPSDLSDHTYTLVKFHHGEKANGDPDWLFRKKQCMHCTDAACMAMCPKQTIKRSDNGFVFIDRSGCIGCGTCVSVCPFSIPRLSDGTRPEDDGIPKSYKCWGCQDRVSNGAEPACVKTCPPLAQMYGDRTEMVAKAQARQAQLVAEGHSEANVYGIDEMGGLHYLYILLRAPSFYGLPGSAELNSSSRRAYLLKMAEEGKRFASRFIRIAV